MLSFISYLYVGYLKTIWSEVHNFIDSIVLQIINSLNLNTQVKK